ncbi:MAG: hypothetical protein ACOVMM_11535 [Chitinophagaceae bacterium]
MFELFYKYLILNNKASLPGIGSFLVEQIPASMDFEHKKLIPPSQKISLNNNVNEQEVLSFQNFLTQELAVNNDESLQKLNTFTQTIQHQITSNGSLELPNIGKLVKNINGGFSLNTNISTENKQILSDLWINKSQAANTNFMDVYSDTMPTIIRRENFVENNAVFINKETEDYWWVWAIVLAIMGLGALLYYYI